MWLPYRMDFLHTTSHTDLGVFALGLIIAGAVSGLAAGVLGIGGGIVIVPVLYHVMAALGIGADVRMHVAIATSLSAMIPAALARVQSARRGIDRRNASMQGIVLLVAIALGCDVATMATGRTLAVVFAVAAIPVVVWLAPGIPKAEPAGKPGRAALALTTVCGFVSALTGIGMDTIRHSVFGRWEAEDDRHRATVSVVGLLGAVAAAFAFAIAGWNVPDLPPDSIGYVNLLGFALIAPVLLATEPAGAALAHMMDLRRLRLVFAGLIVITTARMLWDAFA